MRLTVSGVALSFALLVPWAPGSALAQSVERHRPVRRAFVFTEPQRVAIIGWDLDAMEPFLTRDGRWLLFNNSNDPAIDTNLHFAERVDDATFLYRGEIGGVNTAALEGVASMDLEGTLYFVSTRSYGSTLSTIYRGRFSEGEMSGIEIVAGISPLEPGLVNFDAEISPDGERLTFVDGKFSGSSFPDAADLVIASRTDGSTFERLSDESILANVNTDDLEYAPAMSADGRELFFTRLELEDGTPTFGIWRSWRSSIDQPFGLPSRIRSISGFVEAPALSPDERSLYFHKREDSRFVIYRVTR